MERLQLALAEEGPRFQLAHWLDEPFARLKPERYRKANGLLKPRIRTAGIRAGRQGVNDQRAVSWPCSFGQSLSPAGSSSLPSKS